VTPNVVHAGPADHQEISGRGDKGDRRSPVFLAADQVRCFCSTPKVNRARRRGTLQRGDGSLLA
jgi:hypothetical protein